MNISLLKAQINEYWTSATVNEHDIWKGDSTKHEHIICDNNASAKHEHLICDNKDINTNTSTRDNNDNAKHKHLTRDNNASY